KAGANERTVRKVSVKPWVNLIYCGMLFTVGMATAVAGGEDCPPPPKIPIPKVFGLNLEAFSQYFESYGVQSVESGKSVCEPLSVEDQRLLAIYSAAEFLLQYEELFADSSNADFAIAREILEKIIAKSPFYTLGELEEFRDFIRPQVSRLLG